MKKPEVILFDMGGVLQDAATEYDADSFPVAFPRGLPKSTPVDWFLDMSAACLEQFLALEPPRPAVDYRPLIAEWLVKRGQDPSEQRIELWRRTLERWEARPIYSHVRPTLLMLNVMGVRMGVVSNTMIAAEYLRAHFDGSRILEFFDFTVFSAEFGMSKPHPSIFEHALEAMEVRPENAWYVGDKPQRDVCGARSAGMFSVLVDSAHAGRVHDGPDHVPDLRIPDISALPGIVDDAED